jgi:hypothetical protein
MYYLIGIKGTGMSALALALKSLNYDVIGSDKEESFFTEKADFVLWNYPPYDINVEIKPITLQLGL